MATWRPECLAAAGSTRVGLAFFAGDASARRVLEHRHDGRQDARGAAGVPST